MERATAEAVNRRAAFMDVVLFLFERFSFRPLTPPLTLRTIGTFAPGSIEVRTTPRVTITASAYGSSGSKVLRGISSLCVGPRKYPWSAASMTVWPSVGRMIRESRFWSPQVMFVPLDRLLAGVAFRDGLKAFASRQN